MIKSSHIERFTDFTVKANYYKGFVAIIKKIINLFELHGLLYTCKIKIIQATQTSEYEDLNRFSTVYEQENDKLTLVQLYGKTLVYQEQNALETIEDILHLSLTFDKGYLESIVCRSEVDIWTPVSADCKWQIHSGLKNANRLECCFRELMTLFEVIHIEPAEIEEFGFQCYALWIFNSPHHIQWALEEQPIKVVDFDIENYLRLCTLLANGIVPDELKWQK
jgi:hypothetical protein